MKNLVFVGLLSLAVSMPAFGFSGQHRDWSWFSGGSGKFLARTPSQTDSDTYLYLTALPVSGQCTILIDRDSRTARVLESGRGNVRVRVDQRQIYNLDVRISYYETSIGEARQEGYAEIPVGLLRDVLEGRTIRYMFRNQNQVESTDRFSLLGSTEATRAIWNACRRYTGEDTQPSRSSRDRDYFNM